MIASEEIIAASGAIRFLVQAAGRTGGRHRKTRPDSLDLGERAVASAVGGRTSRAPAALFGASVTSAVNGWRRHRQTGGQADGGRRRRVPRPERHWLLARIAAAPNLRPLAVSAEPAERGVAASYGAVWSFVAAEVYSLEKSLRAAEQERAEVARKRARRRRHQGRIDPAGLVSVDD